ncbi:hypothetical protein CMI45_02090 [Candidatus Pacearchaeota archaeon]|nr:hypothetical protein [Candidatus Pacearchaeota archaeon]|tara:strand:- start:1079 stop:1522 length:444 start_codon:yes stop_codon:yes gene_type:complete
MINFGEGFRVRDVGAHYIIDVSTDIRSTDDSINQFHEALDYIKVRGTDLVVIKIGEDVSYFGSSAISAVLGIRERISKDGLGARFMFCGNRKPVLEIAKLYHLDDALKSELYGVLSCKACKKPRECRYREADQTLDSLVPSEESSIS